MRKSAGGNFSKLPVEDPKTGDVLAVIETPRGSRNKYAFDLDLGTFRLKAVLPQGNVFPFDFGFIPSTRGRWRPARSSRPARGFGPDGVCAQCPAHWCD
jgi:inorganic pyrophosphatase